MKRFKLTAILVTLAVTALLAAAPLAAAQSPTDAQYDKSTKNVERSAEDGDPEGGSLPFTGADLLALGAVALSLGAAGFGLRRLTRTG